MDENFEDKADEFAEDAAQAAEEAAENKTPGTMLKKLLSRLENTSNRQQKTPGTMLKNQQNEPARLPRTPGIRLKILLSRTCQTQLKKPLKLSREPGARLGRILLLFNTSTNTLTVMNMFLTSLINVVNQMRNQTHSPLASLPPLRSV